MNIIVIDTSVIIRSIKGDNNSAYQVLQDILKDVKIGKTSIHAPNLILYELSNALKYTYKDKEVGETIFKELLQLPFHFFSFNHRHSENILSLSYKLNTTVYDTSYHFLAQLLGGTFLTCDKDYFKKACHLGFIELL